MNLGCSRGVEKVEGRITSIPRCTYDGPDVGKPRVGDVAFSSFT